MFASYPTQKRGHINNLYIFKNFTMKKVNVLKGILAIAAIAFCSASLSAKGTVSINTYLKTNYAVVSAHNSELSNFKVKVIDEEGTELYSSPNIKNTSAFQKLFDLNSFENGTYSVVVISKESKAEKIFKVKNSHLVLTEASSKAASIKESSASVNASPFFRKEGDNIYLSHLNFDKSLFSISIDDMRGNEIFNSSLPRETSYSGIFDISRLPEGEYSVLIKSGKELYRYEFNK